jgi:CRP-like cAMP-binding protein
MITTELFRHESEPSSYRNGEIIFKEGDPGDCMYAVLEGTVEITRDGKLLEEIGPGGIFGEMALIDHRPRSGRAVAKTDCKTALVTEKRFYFLVQQTPNFSLHVMRVLTERLRKRTES